eukprot:7117881-Pyramimonas_sp.AAC.1
MDSELQDTQSRRHDHTDFHTVIPPHPLRILKCSATSVRYGLHGVAHPLTSLPTVCSTEKIRRLPYRTCVCMPRALTWLQESSAKASGDHASWEHARDRGTKGHPGQMKYISEHKHAYPQAKYSAKIEYCCTHTSYSQYCATGAVVVCPKVFKHVKQISGDEGVELITADMKIGT